MLGEYFLRTIVHFFIPFETEKELSGKECGRINGTVDENKRRNGITKKELTLLKKPGEEQSGKLVAM